MHSCLIPRKCNTDNPVAGRYISVAPGISCSNSCCTFNLLHPLFPQAPQLCACCCEGCRWRHTFSPTGTVLRCNHRWSDPANKVSKVSALPAWLQRARSCVEAKQVLCRGVNGSCTHELPRSKHAECCRAQPVQCACAQGRAHRSPALPRAPGRPDLPLPSRMSPEKRALDRTSARRLKGQQTDDDRRSSLVSGYRWQIPGLRG